jgi:hypothetical protein
MPAMRWITAALLISLAVSGLISCSESNTPATAKPADEAAAIAALKNINQAQSDFIRRTRRYAQTTAELITDHLLSAEPAAEGYDILMLPSPDAVRYTATATPRTPEARHFFTNQTGVIRAESGKPATAESPGI